MSKESFIKERTINEANLLISLHKTGSAKATIRGLEDTLVFVNGKSFSKSTIHKDLTERLLYIDKALYRKVSIILQENWDARYYRGGEATRKRWLQCK